MGGAIALVVCGYLMLILFGIFLFQDEFRDQPGIFIISLLLATICSLLVAWLCIGMPIPHYVSGDGFVGYYHDLNGNVRWSGGGSDPTMLTVTLVAPVIAFYFSLMLFIEFAHWLINRIGSR